jgi:hypothetical protein
MPIGASYCPGRVTWPDNENSVMPLERLRGSSSSVPIARNHSAPWRRIAGTLAIDSTLLMTVGDA